MSLLAISSEFAHRLAAVTDAQRAQLTEQINIAKPEARIENGVAIIPVKGVLTQDSLISWMFGGTNPESIINMIAEANSENSVKKILLNVDSPGGEVKKILELSEAVKNSKKKVDAYIDGSAGSGAYWAISGARKIYAAETAEIGSIGAILSMTKSQDDDGLYEFISAQSPLKRVDPVTDAGKSEYQTRADEMAEVFINSVAKNRKTTKEIVLDDFGRGGMMIAKKALDAGMIDGIVTFDHYLKKNGGKTMGNDNFQAALDNLNLKMSAIEAAQKKVIEPEVKSPEEIKMEAIEQTLKAQRKLVADMSNVAMLAGVHSSKVLEAVKEGKSLDDFMVFCQAEKAKQTKETAITSTVNPDIAGEVKGFGDFDPDADEEVN